MVVGACPKAVLSIESVILSPYSSFHFLTSHSGQEYSIDSFSISFLPLGMLLSSLIKLRSNPLTNPLTAGFLLAFASLTHSSTAAESGTESI